MEKKTLKQQFWAVNAMLIATVIWGLAFSAQSSGMKFTGAMLFVALRSIIGVMALLIVIMIMDLWRDKRLSWWGRAQSRREREHLLAGGIACGVLIAAASTFQQLGLLYIPAGKTGFLTALYVIFVPVFGLFFHRRTSLIMLAAVFIALGGAYLLCGGVGSIGIGEIFVIICAGLFAGHIIVIDHYAAGCDCVRLSCLQFMTAAAAAALASLIFQEEWLWCNIVSAMPYWMFCGVGSSAIAFTLQMVSQKYLHPVAAALLMSMESVFAVLGGWVFLHEVLSTQELLGCAVILLAVIMAQLPPDLLKRLHK